MNNKNLTNPANIVCNDTNAPYDKYVPAKKVDESQDGYLFQTAMKKLCHDERKDFVIGIDIYANSTWCNVMGRYNCEPVVASFSCFKRSVRQSPEAQIL